jgi:hypothetical protein
MTAVVLLIGFFIVDAAIEMVLAPGHGQARPAKHPSRSAR